MIMDIGRLREKASHRRVVDKPGWTCEYCSKSFAHEKSFMGHHCRPKERLVQLRSPVGQAAYQHYVTWMKLKGHKAPSIDKFPTSRYYLSIMKFAEYAQRVNLPAPENYLKFMVSSNDMSPSLWCRSDLYSQYLDRYLSDLDPYDQVANGVEWLMRLGEEDHRDPATVLSQLAPPELVEAVRKRKLTPWLMLNSNVAITAMKEADAGSRKQIFELINVEHWAGKFAKQPEDRVAIKNILAELGL